MPDVLGLGIAISPLYFGSPRSFHVSGTGRFFSLRSFSLAASPWSPV